MYKYALFLTNASCVILGHHGDDSDENILLNIFRGKDILNLNGMDTFQKIEQIDICRPLLTHPKSEIFEMAEKFNILYLKDTTSKTCYRGFLRDLIPQIKNHDEIAFLKN